MKDFFLQLIYLASEECLFEIWMWKMIVFRKRAMPMNIKLMRFFSFETVCVLILSGWYLWEHSKGTFANDIHCELWKVLESVDARERLFPLTDERKSVAVHDRDLAPQLLRVECGCDKFAVAFPHWSVQNQQSLLRNVICERIDSFVALRRRRGGRQQQSSGLNGSFRVGSESAWEEESEWNALIDCVILIVVSCFCVSHCVFHMLVCVWVVLRVSGVCVSVLGVSFAVLWVCVMC